MNKSNIRTPKNQISGSRLQTFRALFVAREDVHAVLRGNQPVAIYKALTNEVLAAHLAGECRAGTYLIKLDGKTPFLVFDVDSLKRSLLKRIAKRLHKRKITAYVERSKSKGYHIWIFFDKPLQAVKARRFAKLVLHGLDVSRIEVFPKQDEVREGGLGNCIWLPLFGRDVSEDRTVFLDKHFAPLDRQWSFLESIQRTPRKLILEACRQAEPEAKKLSELSKPAGGPITEGERNTTLTSLAGAMRHHGATEETIRIALLKENQERCDPPLPDKEVGGIAASISKYSSAEQPKDRKDSQATKLAAAVVETAKLFHTPEQESYITLAVNGHKETYRLRDRHIKRWLARCFFERSGDVPSTQSLNDALNLLDAFALFTGPEEDVFTRLAEWRGEVFLDLCDPSWRVARITSKSWEVISDPPVKFRRARGMQPLPVPVLGGSIHELRPFLNVRSENDFVLSVSWLVAALNPKGPFPLLVLQGEAGSAKSTTGRVLRDLIDPNTAPLRSEPREVRDLMIAASNAWCVAFDNVSRLPPWLSDALCRLATGGGFGTRTLYTDDEERLFQATRPIVLNGIDGVVVRGDLMDRSVLVELPMIPEEQRKAEKEFWQDFRKVQGRILGALLDGVSCALRRLKRVRLERLPRMADFARWATASEPAFGWPEGTFMSAYAVNRKSANSLTLDASLIVSPLRRLAVEHRVWKGTAAELLRRLVQRANDEVSQRNWPSNPQVLSGQLRRIAPNLRASGIDVQFDEKTGGSRSRRIITIKRSTMLAESDRSEKAPPIIRRFPRPFRFPRE